jgi:hypothetical protein
MLAWLVLLSALVWNHSTRRLHIGAILYSVSNIDSYNDLVNIHGGSSEQ